MEPVIGSARLFAAFENIGLSPGAELRSPFGPGGKPAESVIRAFEDAMAPPGAVPGLKIPEGGTAWDAGSASVREAGAAGDVPPPASVPGPAECMPSQDDPVFRADRTARPGESFRHGSGTAPARGTDALQSPVELYRAQYQMGLLRAHVNVMMHSSQSMTQSLETALKQSG